MKNLRALIFLASVFAGCSSSTPVASPLIELGPVPPEVTLCQLTPDHSTADDVRANLGMPTVSEAFSDGTSTFLFDYDAQTTPNPTVAILQVWFTADRVFTRANAHNFNLPSCWRFEIDAGH